MHSKFFQVHELFAVSTDSRFLSNLEDTPNLVSSTYGDNVYGTRSDTCSDVKRKNNEGYPQNPQVTRARIDAIQVIYTSN